MHVFWGRTHINTGLIVSHVPGREKMPRHQKIPVFLRVPRILYCSLKRLYGVCITYGNTTMQTAEGVWYFPLNSCFKLLKSAWPHKHIGNKYWATEGWPTTGTLFHCFKPLKLHNGTFKKNKQPLVMQCQTHPPMKRCTEMHCNSAAWWGSTRSL